MNLFRLLFPLLFFLVLAKAEDAADDVDDSDIEAEEGTYQGWGQRCGRNHPCEDGLDCVPVPIAKFCFPITCVMESVKSLRRGSNFKLENYGRETVARSGVSAESRMFRRLPGQASLSDDLQVDEMDMRSLLSTMQESPPPMANFTNAFSKCSGKATTDGTTPYYGMSWGLGLVGTYEGDLYWAQGTNDVAQNAILNNCFGFVLGYDLGFSALLGVALTTGTSADLEQGCKQMFPIVEFPPFSLQVGFVDCADPIPLIEVTLGLSAGAGLPGYTSCTTTPLNLTQLFPGNNSQMFPGWQ